MPQIGSHETEELVELGMPKRTTTERAPIMTNRLFCHFAKFASIIANGLCAAMMLLCGLLYMACDIGASEAREGLGRAIVLAGASVVIIAASLCGERCRRLIHAAYCASVLFVLFAGLGWCDHFNRSSDFYPPTTAVIYFCLAVLSMASLVMNRPLRMAPQLKCRSTRFFLVAGGAVLGIAVLFAAAFYAHRITSQYPYAKHFLRRGGSVNWKNGFVVGVFLRSTSTTNEDLRQLTGFPKLRSLYLSDTPVTDAGLFHISGLGTLESLYLDGTAVTDSGLEHLSGLTHLRNLWLYKTDVTDDGLVHLERMTEMGYLDLGYTKVTDAGLPHLFHMKKMYYLHLVGTEVTDDGLRRIVREIGGLSTYNGRTSVKQ